MSGHKKHEEHKDKNSEEKKAKEQKENKEEKIVKEEIEKLEKEVEKEIEEESNKIMSNLWAIGILFLIIGLVVGLIAGIAFNGSGNNSSTCGVSQQITPEQAKQIAEASAKQLIFNQLKALGQQIQFNVKAVNVSDAGDFYNVTVEIELMGKKQPASFYVTKDGKYVTPVVFKAVQNFDNKKAQEEMKKMYEIQNKTEKPKVIIAVMANCPFGNQIEKPLLEVIKLFGDKIEVEPRYIIYPGKNTYNGEYETANGKEYWSLHGNYELDEDVLEYAVWKLYGTQTWIEFVNKVNDQCYKYAPDTQKVRECALNVAKEMGLDVNKLENYVKEHKEDIIQQQYNLTSEQGITGSPTLIINGQVYRGPRTAEAIKEAICSAFINPPAVCNQTLSEQEAQASGSCGN